MQLDAPNAQDVMEISECDGAVIGDGAWGSRIVASYLTTKQLQEILQVDRTTIYRMADGGRLPAVKVGNQWRFPRQEVERWLKTQTSVFVGAQESAHPHPQTDLEKLVAIDCVHQILDTFGDTLGVMFLVTDMGGRPVTRPSNPFPLYQALMQSPVARQRYQALWAELAQDLSLRPEFVPGPVGLLWSRGLIRVGQELQAMLVTGGVAPGMWPPSPEERRRMAQELDVELDLLEGRLAQVPRMDSEGQERLLSLVQRIADIIAHIATERANLFSKLQHIAELSKV